MFSSMTRIDIAGSLNQPMAIAMNIDHSIAYIITAKTSIGVQKLTLNTFNVPATLPVSTPTVTSYLQFDFKPSVANKGGITLNANCNGMQGANSGSLSFTFTDGDTNPQTFSLALSYVPETVWCWFFLDKDDQFMHPPRFHFQTIREFDVISGPLGTNNGVQTVIVDGSSQLL